MPSHFQRSRIALLAGVLAFPWSMLSAQQPDPLLKVQSQFERLVGKTVSEQETRYHEELLKIERSYAAARKYPEAMQVREERLKVEERLRQISRLAGVSTGEEVVAADGQSTDAREGLVLLPEKGLLDGGARFDSSRGVVYHFSREEESSVSWQLPDKLSTGGYEVYLEYACAEDEGGRVQIREGYYFLEGAVNPTAGVSDYQRVFLGTLRVREGSDKIEMIAMVLSGTELFRLKRVELIPANR